MNAGFTPSRGLAFVWTHGEHGSVRVTLSAAVDGGPTTLIECWFPMKADGGMMSAQLLGQLPPSGRGTIEITSSNDRANQLVEIDGGTIRLELLNGTMWNGGDLARRTVVISN